MTARLEDSIAIVGMACRLPGAADTRQYWDALRAGAEKIRHFDRDLLITEGADPRQVKHPDFVPARGVLAGSHGFDWQFFGYSRAEAAAMDPQQRVFLECACAAIDDAGIDPGRFPGWIGVYAGADKVFPRADRELSELTRALGEEKDFLATRVAYKLGLRGPAVTVQTACSTSMTAVHLAVQALRCGDCDAALAGGVTVLPPHDRGYFYEPGGILSPDGHCRPFDEQAGGTVPSEGAGAVVLKRARDALRDGDRIAAVILGSAFNNDGAEKIGFTAPSVEGQREAIRRAQVAADVDPADIGYVEAHGTATRLGDPVEVQALTEVFRVSGGARASCWLGAVKGNIGHTGAASGVAGLIKTALMLEHRELVPTLHFTRPNPLLELDETPFAVCTQARPWPDRGAPLAAVSSFGLGGTNVHVVLGGAPQRALPAPYAGPRLLALSAASADALGRMRRDMAETLTTQPGLTHSGLTPPGLTLSGVTKTLAGRRPFGHRQAFIAADLADAARLMSEAPDSPEPVPLKQVAFLFPGQGTLRGAAAAVPYRMLPGFRACFDEIREAIATAYGLDLSPVASSSAAADWFLDTVHQQLGLFALGYALGRQLGDWGVKPTVMLGNSIGEYAAAALAGTWAVTDAARLVVQRARAMWDTKPGRMAAVSASADEVRRRIEPDSGVTIAVAAPGTAVISGGQQAVDNLLASAALHGLDVRLLDVERSFHCAAMEPAARAVEAAVAAVPSRRPRLRLVSAMTGGYADPDTLRMPGYWAQHLLQPVLLDAAMSTLLRSGCDTFIELGPGSSMISSLRRLPDWDAGYTAVPMLGRTEGGEHSLLRALGTLWERGADISLDDMPGVYRCALPPHPFSTDDPETCPTTASCRRPSEPPGGRPLEPAVARPGNSPLRDVLERLWCAALGVPSVAAEDDFFALGGESLTVVNLLVQVREKTGLAISVTEFSSDATFARLVQLARQEQTEDASAAVRVVTLQDGPGRPVFLAADAAGNALSYRALAGLLGGVRPVHGLELSGETMAGLTIEDSAAHHVDAVLRTQESGPYTLGGWSFGAVLAHEMARQLVRRGEQVDVLICLDAFVSGGRRLLQSAFDPGLLAGSLWLQTSAVVRIGAVGRQVRRDPGLRQLLLVKSRVVAHYRPQPVSCRAVVLKTGLSRREASRLCDRLSALYLGGVQVLPAGGDHWSMLAHPHVEDLADSLREVLLGSEALS